MVFQKKTKQRERERVEDMKFPGIYPISESERSFTFFNGAHSKMVQVEDKLVLRMKNLNILGIH